MRSSLDIVIVNWNSGRQLDDCLASIASTKNADVSIDHVVVVDNASTDGSLRELNFDLPLRIIRNPENRGFAAACNQGAKGSTADFLLFLNPDTLLIDKSLEKPVAFLNSHENAQFGIVGVQLIDSNENVTRSCARFPTPTMFFWKMVGLDRLLPAIFQSYFMTEWDHAESRGVDHVMGAFFLVRRTLFESLRGFDEKFFVYLEDLDFSLRAHRAGWKSFYLADTRAYHGGGGTSDQIKAKRLFYSLRSRILYGYKHFSLITATSLMFGTLFLEPLSRMTLCICRLSGSQIIETVKGYSLLWASLHEIFRSPKREWNKS